jgi:uncharacterized heparinase superfamily protein
MAPQLVERIRRGLRKPPSYILARAAQEGRRVADRWLAPARGRRLNEARLLSALAFPSVDAAWRALLERPFPFLHPVTERDLDRLAPGETDRIRGAAEDALAHRVDLLGSGPVELGATIDWHADFKTGRRWPPQYCHLIDYANLDEPSDVKSPWELSRLQWLLPAAQAYRLFGDERYAEGVREVLEQWMAANPYAGSVNWSCTMEAALRILTFTWLIRACGESRAFANRSFRLALLRSLVLHADFTERYIERSDINGNHYTADAAALVFAGLFLGDGAQAKRWLETGWTILAEEIERQVFQDGVDFEASTAYHRLVFELFLLPALYGQAHGRTLPVAWRERLVAMARFTAAYSRSDGRPPNWGDSDDARALPMAGKGLFDHRYLIALARLGLDEAGLAPLFSGPVAELVWLCGAPMAERLAGRARAARRSEAFPVGGFYVLAGDDDHVFVDCGPVGLAGRGGHGHNDLLSFEAALEGQRLIVDPGAFVYTASPVERNAFRSTAYHNTPQADEAEINRFPPPHHLWSLQNDAEPEVRLWRPGVASTTLVISHSGYERLRPPIRPVRTIELDHRNHRLKIEDAFEGGGDHDLTSPLHFAPDVAPRLAPEDGLVILETARGLFHLTWLGDGWRASLEDARISPSYGVVQPSKQLVFRAVGPSATLQIAIRRVAGLRSGSGAALV